ncbi:MAG: hypothetical protein HY005_00470 [Candidatus Staskawiczbacteria bacterium]|nr:hypothetical protein [Candidatus Staskawiczbacteria bacterium]MBI3337085.1 hypothetical protein [Candidatus Staskawiczbacteria bacterium]
MKKFFKKHFYNFKESSGLYIKKIPWILGKNAFLCILVFILIDILIGGLLFYKYVLLIDAQEPEISSVYSKFQENIYRSVAEEWQNRENIFKNLLSLDKNYTDPFK